MIDAATQYSRQPSASSSREGSPVFVDRGTSPLLMPGNPLRKYAWPVFGIGVPALTALIWRGFKGFNNKSPMPVSNITMPMPTFPPIHKTHIKESDAITLGKPPKKFGRPRRN